MYKNKRSYEHKKNRNRAVAWFRFFVANAKKGNMKCFVPTSFLIITRVSPLQAPQYQFFHF